MQKKKEEIRIAPLGSAIKTTNAVDRCYYQVAMSRTCVNC